LIKVSSPLAFKASIVLGVKTSVSPFFQLPAVIGAIKATLPSTVVDFQVLVSIGLVLSSSIVVVSVVTPSLVSSLTSS